MRPELPVLVKARAKIADPADWGKGRRGNSGNRPMTTCCAAEAVEETCDDYELRVRAFAKLRGAANIPNLWCAIADWNDAPERTHAEVLAAFDKAIASAS